ncbi:hypothetical protein GCM10009021_18600 [Halarchaeum nitratireducens]|uniref:Uncharacterized protein n=1 Tax=Halarchaeum nitratireducens TaxID=489913 RepID=A0A830GC45_9EURY|nr:hypothetical protein GCM10009021_18600 [Halarchaeum nitratireducens]
MSETDTVRPKPHDRPEALPTEKDPDTPCAVCEVRAAAGVLPDGRSACRVCASFEGGADE